MDSEAIALMKQNGTYYVPTIIAGLWVAEKSKIPGFFPEKVRPKAAEIGPKIKSTFAKAYQAGVKIAFGTDSGVSKHGDNATEFRHMVEAGMPPMKAIEAATKEAAKLLGLIDSLGTISKGKIADTFGPLGPWLVTADEFGDPQSKGIWTKVNGEMRQNGHTSDMVFGIAQLVSYVSEFMSLNPGDVLTTGSPHGVAAGFDPPKWLQAGDVIEMGIDGLGEQKHEVLRYKD